MNDPVQFKSSIELVQKTGGPSVNSGDPQERKLARRLRLEKRRQIRQNLMTPSVAKGSSRSLLSMTSMSSLEVKEEDIYEEQLKKSTRVIDTYRAAAETDCSNFVKTTYKLWNDRSIRLRQSLRDTLKDIEEESENSEKKFRELLGHWTSVLPSTDVYELKKRIEEHKKSWEMLLGQRDQFLLTIKNMIAESYNEYERRCAKQTKEGEALKKILDEHLKVMRNVFRNQFKIVERTIKEVKSNYYTSSWEWWQTMYDNIAKYNNKLFDQKLRNKQLLAKLIEDAGLDVEEEYRHYRIREDGLLSESTLYLNTLKFLLLQYHEAEDYNNMVRDHRRRESIICKGMYKRLICILTDKVIRTKEELKTLKEEHQKKIYKFSKNIALRKRSILELEAKADRLTNVNENTFNQLWQLNLTSLKMRIEKIMHADRLLHEMLLGVTWHGPDLKRLTKMTNMPGYQKAIDMVARLYPDNNSQLPKILKTKWNNDHSTEPEDPELCNLLAYRQLAKHILMMISDKAEFLTENCLNKVIAHFEDDQRSLVRLDNIFFDLKINKKEHINILMSYFQPYCYCITCADRMSQDFSTVNMGTVSVMSSTFLRDDTSNAVDHPLTPVINALDYLVPPNEAIYDVLIDIAHSDEILPYDFKTEDIFIDVDVAPSIFVMGGVAKPVQSVRRTKKDQNVFQCMYHHQLVIRPVYVIEALRHFILNLHKLGKRIPTMRERLIRKRKTVTRLLNDKEIKEFWTNLGNIYGKSHLELWKQLEAGLKRYYDILVERKNACEEVLTLRRRNRQLKRQLKDLKQNWSVAKPICKLQGEPFCNPGYETKESLMKLAM